MTERLSYIRARAEALDSVGEPSSMGSWLVPFREGWTREHQLEAYYLESLHCALSHTDPLIAFRAYTQAVGYLTELRCLHASGIRFQDDLLTARNRLEGALRTTEGGDEWHLPFKTRAMWAADRASREASNV